MSGEGEGGWGAPSPERVGLRAAPSRLAEPTRPARPASPLPATTPLVERVSQGPALEAQSGPKGGAGFVKRRPHSPRYPFPPRLPLLFSLSSLTLTTAFGASPPSARTTTERAAGERRVVVARACEWEGRGEAAGRVRSVDARFAFSSLFHPRGGPAPRLGGRRRARSGLRGRVGGQEAGRGGLRVGPEGVREGRRRASRGSGGPPRSSAPPGTRELSLPLFCLPRLLRARHEAASQPSPARPQGLHVSHCDAPKRPRRGRQRGRSPFF